MFSDLSKVSPDFFSPFLNCGSGENACRLEVKMLEEEKEKNHAGEPKKSRV